MAETILKMRSITKTYILGSHKNAKKAQKAIAKAHKKYSKYVSRGYTVKAQQLGLKLNKAQLLFADDKYEASYKQLTGKKLTAKKQRGSVVHALSNVNLNIYAGDLVAIMGPSGSGKSTLLNMLGILDQPTSGNLYIKDKDITTIRSKHLPSVRSKELGFVFQSFNLVPTLTALENVMLPLKYKNVKTSARKLRAKKALELVGLGNRIGHRPAELSGGQQQRVAIARSVVNNPAIILADELTGELDSKMTAEIMKMVANLNRQGQTFIIVTHNPEVAKLCRRIIFMKDGKIVKLQIRK